MKCPSCQHDNPDDSKFCLRCGQGFDIKCPQCGKSLPPDAFFCNECGQNLRGSGEPYQSKRFDEAASYILGFPKENGDHGK